MSLSDSGLVGRAGHMEIGRDRSKTAPPVFCLSPATTPAAPARLYSAPLIVYAIFAISPGFQLIVAGVGVSRI
jgi:hypothetical protein